MKTLKQLSSVLFLTIFIFTSNNLIAQSSSSTPILSSNEKVDISKVETKSPLESYTYDSWYFEEIDAKISISINQDGKIVSITDSSNSLSDNLLAEIISKINANSASSCGCRWYDVYCRAYCALVEAGVIEE